MQLFIDFVLVYCCERKKEKRFPFVLSQESIWLTQLLIDITSWLLAEQRETVTIHFSWEVVNQHNCWLALPVDCWETKEKGVPFVLSWEVVYWHICWLVELVNCWESKKKRVPFILNFILFGNWHICWSTLLMDCWERKVKGASIFV